jgi:Domain of unknown function (DUF4173)
MLLKTSPITSFQKKIIWFATSFFLAILADNWFWLQSPRLGWFVWCIFLIATRYILEVIVTKNIDYKGLFVGAVICILAFFIYLRSSELLIFINTLTTIYLIFLMWRGYKPTKDHNPFVSNFVIEPLSTWIQAVEKGFANISIFKPQTKLSENKVSGAIFRGLLITIPIITIFSTLLSWSDANFAKIITDSFAAISKYFSIDGIIRLGFMLGTTILLFGLGFVYKQNVGIKKENTKIEVNQSINWETTIIFSSVILLFASYLVLQASYLIGGRSFVVKIDGTYADFAKRGFFELSMVTVLIFGMILVSDRFVNKLRARSKSFGLLASTIIIQTFLLLLSAWSKLSLYIQGYGYTNLRLYTQVWIICMGLSFALVIAREINWLRPNIFSNGVLVIFSSGLVVLNIINPEYTIAKYNLTQTNWNISEIANYGYDAYPAIKQLLIDPNIQSKIDVSAYCSLKSKSIALQKYKLDASWNQKNFGLDQAQEILNKVRFVDRNLAC